jgi:hypothetical protein
MPYKVCWIAPEPSLYMQIHINILIEPILTSGSLDISLKLKIIPSWGRKALRSILSGILPSLYTLMSGVIVLVYLQRGICYLFTLC